MGRRLCDQRGCSDDGFDYFRGWLIARGRQAFDQAVADPDALANLAVIRSAALAAGATAGGRPVGRRV